MRANGCIQPGIVATGTYALDTNVSGNTSNDRPWAAWAEPATSPISMNIHVNEKPKMITSRKANSAPATEPWGRNPTAKPIAVVTAAPHATSTVSARARPPATANRGIGSERRRSTTPCWRSSATPEAAPIPENSTPVTT